MTYTAEVVDTYPLTPRVKGFRLRVPDHEFSFTPGQHTTVRFESGGREIVRPYTPTNLPGTSELTLAIKRYDDGLASSYMHGKRPGDTVTIGPLEGNLGIEDLDRDVAFLATGTGITPMCAMSRHYIAEGSGEATLVFGERDEETIIHRALFNELAAEHPAFSVAFTLSEPNWEWIGHTGYVQDHLEELFDDFESRDFYVCGVPQMVVETKARLRKLGAPEERIHSEGWEDGAVSDE